MPELIAVPDYINMHDAISQQLLARLVEEGKLPADIQFRLLSILDDDERRKVGVQQVMAALGLGEPSADFSITEPLPPAVYMPFERPAAILRRVDEDYFMSGTWARTARQLGVASSLATRAWTSYIHHIAPDLYSHIVARIEHKMTDAERFSDQRFRRVQAIMMSHVALRSDALKAVHDQPGIIHGHGPAQQEVLHWMLLDSYPELRP